MHDGGQSARVPPVLRDATGGVIECEITGTDLRLVLTEDAASTLGLPQHTRFVLDLPPHQREMLGRGLQRVLTSGRADAIPQLLHI